MPRIEIPLLWGLALAAAAYLGLLLFTWHAYRVVERRKDEPPPSRRHRRAHRGEAEQGASHDETDGTDGTDGDDERDEDDGGRGDG